MADSTIAALGAAAAFDGTELVYVVQGGADKKATTSLFGVKNNFAATTSPGVSDDSGSGYGVGSIWLNINTGATWRARSVSVGAAKWVRNDTSDFFGYVAGNWYAPLPGVTDATGAALAANTIRLHPTIIKERCTISDLAGRITTGSAGNNVQFAIYANNPATNRPTGTALGATASILVTSTGPVPTSALTANAQLEPGLYWLAVNSDNAVVVFSAMSNTNTTIGAVIGSATMANVMSGNTAALFTLSSAQTYGTWPDLTSATITESTNTAFAMIFFKVTSIP